MKRVLIFSLAYYPHVGGAEVAVKEITDRLTDIEFHMVTLRMDDSPRESMEGRVHVHRVGFGTKSLVTKFLFQFIAVHKADELHRQHRFDATWALMAHSAGVPAMLFKNRHPRVPYLLNLQEGDPPRYIEWLLLPLWPLFKAAFRRADVITALSTFLAAWAKRMGYKGEVEIVPNGVDVKRFVGPRIPHHGTVLITSSRLVYKNAVDDIIRALPLLEGGVRLQILGTGTDRTMLRDLAVTLGVIDRVAFLGFIEHREMPRYLHAADIFIRPSRSEGQGASFIEAMGAGLPVIATQEGGISDFLFDEKRDPDKETTGWAVDVNAPEQIAETVKDIMAHPDKVARVTERARDMVTAKYDWDIIAAKMKTIFERIFVI